jgi:glycosyltransferase involved in cell wall biosynthesis
VVADGRTGLLAPEGDQEALADRLARLAGDPDRWPGMGEAAGELARRSFDVRVCAVQLVDAYREAVRLAGDRRDPR